MIFNVLGVCNISWNWIYTILPYTILRTFWVVNPPALVIFFFTSDIAINLAETAIGPLFMPGSAIFTVVIVLTLPIHTAGSLLPYIFCCPTQPVYVLSCSFPIWLGYMRVYIKSNSTSIWAHCLPSGTPVALWPLIVCVELIRSLIRPVTLSVRLIANIIAGHLLLGLVRRKFGVVNWALNIVLLPALVGLTSLEIGVRVIQPYVFSLLVTLYVREASRVRLCGDLNYPRGVHFINNETHL